MPRIDYISRAVMTAETTTKEHKKRLSQTDRKLLMACCKALQHGRADIMVGQKGQIRQLIKKLSLESNFTLNKKSNCIVLFIRRIFKGLSHLLHLRLSTKKLEKSIHQSSQRFFSNPVFKEMTATLIATKGLQPQKRKEVLKVMEQFSLLAFCLPNLQHMYQPGLKNHLNVYLRMNTGCHVKNFNTETLALVQKAPELLIAKYLEAQKNNSLQNFFENAFAKKQSLNESYELLVNFNKPVEENNEEIEQLKIVEQPLTVSEEIPQIVSKEVPQIIPLKAPDAPFDKQEENKDQQDTVKKNEEKIVQSKKIEQFENVIEEIPQILPLKTLDVPINIPENKDQQPGLQLDEEVFNNCKIAADQGNRLAQLTLGSIYEKGHGRDKSDEEAFKYYKLAADQNNPDAQYKMSLFYAEGTGVKKDDHEALRYCKLAAKQGHAPAQCNLGFMYIKGQGVEQSNKKSLKYFILASDQNEAAAQCNLGVMYAKGDGVLQSYDEAFKYFKLAANQNNSDAQNNLGLMYEHGQGVEQSYEKASHFYKLAADQNNVHAQYNLSMLYTKGRGVGQSDEEAYKYLKLAASQGYEQAMLQLEIIFGERL